MDSEVKHQNAKDFREMGKRKGGGGIFIKRTNNKKGGIIPITEMLPKRADNKVSSLTIVDSYIL